jgi:hypothetical protein
MGANAFDASKPSAERQRVVQPGAPNGQELSGHVVATSPAGSLATVRPLFGATTLPSGADRTSLLARLHPAQRQQMLVAMQRTVGNTAVQRLVRGGTLPGFVPQGPGAAAEAVATPHEYGTSSPQDVRTPIVVYPNCERQVPLQRAADGAPAEHRVAQKTVQRQHRRHPGVQDNGVLTRDVPVTLGNLSGTLPRGTYVEVVGQPSASTLRVKVWSGYGGQETDIPRAAFDHEDQRPDRDMDRADMGEFGRIPVSERLPFMPSARLSQRAEQHQGVDDNGRLNLAVGHVTLGGHVGTLPAGTYVEVIRGNPDGSRVLRVWSGYGGQETTFPAATFAAVFVREQRSDRRMDVPDLLAYQRQGISVRERLPLSDSVRLRVIDNGVVTSDLDTDDDSSPIVAAGTYVEVLEYRNNVVVLRPHSGGQPPPPGRFVTTDRGAFSAAFRHQPQIDDEADEHDRPRPGRVDQRVRYAERTEPLWEPSGPQLEDIRQGWIGTCWVLAAAGALLRQHPTIITDQIFQGNAPTTATFQAHLYPEAGSGATAGPMRTVTVDRYLPAQNFPPAGEDLSAYASPRRALWPAVLEKAFAEVFRGYDDVGQGGPAAYAMRVLTGNVTAGDPRTPEEFDPRPLTDAALLARLQALERARAAVTLNTRSASPFYLNGQLHIIRDHAYVFTHLDGNRAQLFNPHGTDQPLPLTMAQVRQYSVRITARRAR